MRGKVIIKVARDEGKGGDLFNFILEWTFIMIGLDVEWT